MGKSLTEYAAENPQELPEMEREQLQHTADIMAQARELQQNKAKIERLKTSILTQLEKGNEPQFILYTALEAIGAATNDDAFTTTGKEYLDHVYKDLAQQSLLTDNAAIAAARVDELKAGYNDRLRRQTERQLKNYSKIIGGLNDILDALSELEE